MADSHEHISCQQVVDLVTEYLEGAMAVDDRALFEQHLNFCDGCVWYVDQIKTTVATVGRISEEDVPEEMRERLLTAFRDWNARP
jgi:anti-sigma factor (TIGR02949 family)